jgi:hypothetical protein
MAVFSHGHDFPSPGREGAGANAEWGSGGNSDERAKTSILARFRGVHALCMAVVAAGMAEVHDIGNRKQLFIDSKFIEQPQGVTMRMNPPVKDRMVVVATNPWEEGILSGAGAVIEDGGKFRMWYTANAAHNYLPAPAKSTPAIFRLCYAESNDGINWVKPNLGLYEYEGSRANNIIMETNIENAGVLIDPVAPAHQRYKLAAILWEKGTMKIMDPVGGFAPAPESTSILLPTG